LPRVAGALVVVAAYLAWVHRAAYRPLFVARRAAQEHEARQV